MENRKQGLSRRGFVGLLSTLGVGMVGLAACGKAETATPAAAAAGNHAMASMPGMASMPSMASMPGMAAAAGTPAAAGSTASPTPTGQMTADEMDKMHEAGIKAFPAKTAGLGGQPLQYR